MPAKKYVKLEGDTAALIATSVLPGLRMALQALQAEIAKWESLAGGFQPPPEEPEPKPVKPVKLERATTKKRGRPKKKKRPTGDDYSNEMRRTVAADIAAGMRVGDAAKKYGISWVTARAWSKDPRYAAA